MIKKNKKKKYNDLQAYFGSYLDAIQGNPIAIEGLDPTRELVGKPLTQGIVPTADMTIDTTKAVGPDNKITNIDERANAFTQQATKDAMANAKKKDKQGNPMPQVDIKSLVGSIFPFINALVGERDPVRTKPFDPLQVYNPHPQGTGSQALYKAGGKLSAAKAKEMLRDGTANGKKLTKKQKRYFGMVAAGKADMGATLGDPIIQGTNITNVPNSPDLDAFNLYNSLNGAVALGGDPRKNAYGKGMLPDLTKGKGKEAYDLLDDVFIYNNRPDTKAMSPEQRVRTYYEMESKNPNVSAFKKKYKNYTQTPPMKNGGKIGKKEEAFWGAIVGAAAGQGAQQGGKSIMEGLKTTAKNSAQAPQEILNFISQMAQFKDQFGQGGGYTPGPYLQPDQLRYMDNGGQMSGQNQIQLHDEGSTELISYNPYDGGTIQLNGPSHAQDGIDMSYGNSRVEAEGGETAVKDAEGNLHIMGNMSVPGSKVKFKTMSKKIAEKEQDYESMKAKGVALVNMIDPKNKYDKLKFNAGQLMMEGGDLGQRDLVKKKNELASLQNALLETAEEFNLDPEALSEGKERKAKKGTFSKAAVGKKLDPGPKFLQLKALAQSKLEALYPGQKVEVKESGAGRPIEQQRGLKAKGASKTSVSLHNVGGARDYLLYVDGKLVKDAGVYKQVVQAPAKDLGLYNIGDWDPGHIGAVQEGKGNPFAQLMKEHPDLKNTPEYKGSVAFLKDLINNKKADAQEIRAYNQLTGMNIPASMASKNPDYGSYAKNLPSGQGEWFNQNFVPSTQQVYDPGFPTINLPEVPLTYKAPVTPTPDNPDAPPLEEIVPPTETAIPTNSRGLGVSQILPELLAIGNNRLEPVAARQYAPLLEQPYQVSFQDRLNENQATFNSIERQVGNNPLALSALSAQQYQADSGVLADEFRFNQREANRVYNQNRDTLNDAQLKNLAIADQQYVRQSQAKSNTKAQSHVIASSIAAKYNQNRLENQKLQLYENLYNFRAQDTNQDGIDDKMVNYNPTPVFDYGLGIENTTPAYQRTREIKDAAGMLKQKTITTPSLREQRLQDLKIQKAQQEQSLVPILKRFKNLF